MKRNLPLVASLSLNAVLAASAVALLLHRPPVKDPSASNSSQRSATPRTLSTPDPLAVQSIPVNSNRNRNWLQDLREAGVPNSVLARLVIGDFESRWEKQRRDIQQQCARGDLDGKDYGDFEAQHDVEQEKELRAVLGDDGFRQWDKENLLRDFDGRVALSSAEGDALYDAKKDLVRQQRELAGARRSGAMDQEDYCDAQAGLERDHEQQLKTVLGPERYAALKDASVESQGALRRELKQIHSSDTELAAMLNVQRQWTERCAEFERSLEGHPLTEQAYEAQHRALDAARDREYERLLGADRFAELQKIQDRRYQALRQYAAAWKLNGEEIDHLYGILRDHEKSANDYKQRARLIEEEGTEVDWEGVRGNLWQFAQQTEETLRSYLGDERFQKLNGKNALEFGN